MSDRVRCFTEFKYRHSNDIRGVPEPCQRLVPTSRCTFGIRRILMVCVCHTCLKNGLWSSIYTTYRDRLIHVRVCVCVHGIISGKLQSLPLYGIMCRPQYVPKSIYGFFLNHFGQETDPDTPCVHTRTHTHLLILCDFFFATLDRSIKKTSTLWMCVYIYISGFLSVLACVCACLSRCCCFLVIYFIVVYFMFGRRSATLRCYLSARGYTATWF